MAKKNDQLFRDAPELKLSRLRRVVKRVRSEDLEFVLRALAHLSGDQVGHVVRYFETAAEPTLRDIYDAAVASGLGRVADVAASAHQNVYDTQRELREGNRGEPELVRSYGGGLTDEGWAQWARDVRSLLAERDVSASTRAWYVDRGIEA